MGSHSPILESTRILQLQLQLAELAALGSWDVGAGLHRVLVERQRDGGPVIGEEALHRLVGAACAAVGDGGDFDFVAGGLVLGDGRRDGRWGRCRKGGKREESGCVLHLEGGVGGVPYSSDRNPMLMVKVVLAWKCRVLSNLTIFSSVRDVEATYTCLLPHVEVLDRRIILLLIHCMYGQMPPGHSKCGQPFVEMTPR